MSAKKVMIGPLIKQNFLCELHRSLPTQAFQDNSEAICAGPALNRQKQCRNFGQFAGNTTHGISV
jgi:hypothetical protein